MSAPPANPLSAMFEWWNQAYATGQLTDEGFGRHFSPTATLRVNGALRAHGLDGLLKHFSLISASTNQVLLERPPIAKFIDDEGRFPCSYHFVTAQSGSRIDRERVMAIAQVRDGRIQEIGIVGVPAAADDAI
jgi:hypothetical protein